MSASTAALPPLPLRHCYWVVPGLLLAGEHPNGPTRDKTKDRLKKLLAAGIECFVDLTKPTELLRYDTYLPFYVEYARKSIKDHGLPGSRAQMTEILDYIANSMRAGRPVYVHCRAGIGRTGTVVGCLLVERGLAGDTALDELNRLWQQCRRSKSWAFIPETDPQATYVREWKPTLEGSGFELNSLATAVATVGPMTTAGSIRPGVLSVADVQARAASQATGAGQARAAVENLAAGKGRSGSSPNAASSPNPAFAQGAASSPNPAFTQGAASSPNPAFTQGAASSPNPAFTQGAASSRGAAPSRGVGHTEPAATHDVLFAGGGGRNAPATSTHDSVERGEISPSIRAEIADALAGRSSTVKAGNEIPIFVDGLLNADNGSPTNDAVTSRAEPGAVALRTDAATPRVSAPNGQPSAGGAPSISQAKGGSATEYAGSNADGAPMSHGSRAGAKAATYDLDASATLELTGPAAGSSARSPAAGIGGGRRSRSADAGVATSSAGLAAGTVAGSAGANAPSAAGSAGAAAHPPAEPAVGFDPLLDPATLAAARNLRERFVGTLFGLAVGDAVAAATQFRRPGSFSPVGDMIGGGPFDLPRGAWSDDTAMALCLAESLLECDGFDARDQVQRYSRWQQEGYLTSTGQCVGITASTARSLALAKWRRVVFPGSHDPEQLDPEPLSRIAPIALFYFVSPETTLIQSADASRTTCQAPAVLDACRRLGRALNAALSGQPKTKTLADVANLTEAAAQSNNTAASALAAALWAFGSTDNFRDAVLRAANVGGNSDVVASVCGQLAGAHYGVSAIPQSWRSGLMQKDLIEGYADRLLAHSLVSLSNS